jgi:1,4-dihydroxy-2-naphthoyl-CoA hydrolase
MTSTDPHETAHETSHGDESAAALAEDALRGTLSERMGMRCLRLGPDGGEMTMPVEGNLQPAGLLHGGATIALAETIGSMAALLQARAVHGEGAQAVGTSISATHHRSGRSGAVTARCRSLHLGRQVASYLVEVVDEQERLLSTIQVSTMLLAPRG